MLHLLALGQPQGSILTLFLNSTFYVHTTCWTQIIIMSGLGYPSYFYFFAFSLAYFIKLHWGRRRFAFINTFLSGPRAKCKPTTSHQSTFCPFSRHKLGAGRAETRYGHIPCPSPCDWTAHDLWTRWLFSHPGPLPIYI